MTPIEVTKQKLGHLNLSDSELVQIRDVVDMLADNIVRGFWVRHKEHYEKLYKEGAIDEGGISLPGARVVSDTAKQGEGATD